MQIKDETSELSAEIQYFFKEVLRYHFFKNYFLQYSPVIACSMYDLIFSKEIAGSTFDLC